MYQVSDLSKGQLVKLDGEPYRIIDYQHKSVARGGAQATVKLKNLITGHTRKKTFQGSDKVEPAEVDLVDMQYLYQKGDQLVFMNPDSYDQEVLDTELVGGRADYLKEGSQVIVQFFEGQPIGIELPDHINLEVTQAPPAVKGNTSSGAEKDITLETGATVSAPLFIEPGDTVKIDTRSGEYVERA